MTRVLSCGVIVTDGRHVLIGHATGSARWDIPKGQSDPGELPEQAARRELLEETGLDPDTAPLQSLGHFDYLPRKDLALFVWRRDIMPDPAVLVCQSHFILKGRSVPEFDHFACPLWPDALPKLGKAMAARLTVIAAEQGWC
ncbi:NUDIX domain-containing protein [Acidisphaera sp. L21]|uniref:NUDIX hydrolase n=1 Tax=Acidisphaera sp. L21 TaxID=1641851 RepID=UPI00131E9F87|nr:NUDIX domain-containing protein [Acidisphaera sp. L21]